MDLNPRYWYTNDDGNVEPYHYCGLCLAGPFKKTDENILFVRVNRVAYCKKCSSISHNLPVKEAVKIAPYKRGSE